MVDKKDNPFSYSTDPELNRIFDNLCDLTARVKSTLEKADRAVGFAESASFIKMDEIKVELPNYRTLRNPDQYSAWARKNSLDMVKARINEDIELIEKKIAEEKIKNVPIVAHNEAVKKTVTEIMTRLGVTPSYTTYEYATSRSRTKKSVPHTAGYINDLHRCCPVNPVSSAEYKIREYKAEFERWLKAEIEAETKEKIEKDEATFKKYILDDSAIVMSLAKADVNVLEEVKRAMPGKKIEVIRYCISQGIQNLKNKNPIDDNLIEALEDHSDKIR